MEVTAAAFGLQPPQSAAAAIGLRPSPRVRASAAAGFAAPESDHLFLTLRLDAYQKAVGPRDLHAPVRTIRPSALREAAKHACRRYGAR